MAILVACGSSAGSPAARVGQPAPGFTLDDVNGQRVSLSDFRGRPVLVNFWASWCLPCAKELPLFLVAMGEHPDLVLLGVVFRDQPGAARHFRNGIGGEWPALLDPGGRVATAYLVQVPPQTFFVDRAGVVRHHQIGELSKAELEVNLRLIL